MKKISVCLLALLLAAVLFSIAAADAEMTLSNENLIVFEDENQGYFFAKVTNSGDKGAYVDSGNLVTYDADGEVVYTNDWVRTNPGALWLDPGQEAYYYSYIWDNALYDQEIDSFEFSTGARDWGYKFRTIPCDAELYYEGSNNYDNCLFVTFTNEGNTLLHDFTVLGVVYDNEGRIVFARGDSYDEIGLHPGSTITLQVSFDNDVARYMESNNLEPGMIDAIVYVLGED